MPLQEARLSSFLAADRNNATTESGPEVLEAFLSGQIIDLQSLLNVNNLLEANGKVSESGFESFERLFEVLGLPQAELDRMAREPAPCLGHQRRAAMAPLRPQRVEQLAWLGLSAQTLAALNPTSPCCPRRTAVNLNTRQCRSDLRQRPPAQHGRRPAAGRRTRAHPLQDQQRRLQAAAERRARPGQGTPEVGVASRYFEVRARLRLNELVVEERSVIERSAPGGRVTTLERERGVARSHGTVPGRGQAMSRAIFLQSSIP